MTTEIIRLAQEEGLNVSAIARRVGCSAPNVSKTLNRHDVEAKSVRPNAVATHISVLSVEHRRWLMGEARKIKANWRDLARAMLIDAIEEARDGNG